jgi:hypothetical protein
MSTYYLFWGVDRRFPGVIWALLWTSFEFGQAAHGEDKNVDATRSLAAQIIAVRVIRSMSFQDVVRSLTLDFDLPNTDEDDNLPTPVGGSTLGFSGETTGLLDAEMGRVSSPASGHQPTMSALEVAIVAEALRFLASTIVQEVIEGVWNGDIVLWGDIDTNATTARKKPTIYPWRPTWWVGYARLRVPRYRFAFQVLNFGILLGLFLLTLLVPYRDHISVQEVLLDIWFLGFAYAELGIPSGRVF